MKQLKDLIKKLPGSVALSAALLTASFGVQAGPLDLTGGGSGFIGGVDFISMTQQPTGTGVIQPFVQLSGNPAVKQAYNTTVNGVYDNSSPDNWNHAVRVGNIGFINVGGVTLMRFLLDINQVNRQTNHANWLSLDDVQIYLSLTPNQSIQPVLNNFDLVNLGSLVYQMDAKPDDNAVIINYSLNSGSGSGDIYMDVPLTDFGSAFAALNLTTAAQKNNAYLYLFSRVGELYRNNDGFEEWAAIKGTGLTDEQCPPGSTDPKCVTPPEGFPTPEPATLAILGAGLFAMAIIRRRRGNGRQ